MSYMNMPFDKSKSPNHNYCLIKSFSQSRIRLMIGKRMIQNKPWFSLNHFPNVAQTFFPILNSAIPPSATFLISSTILLPATLPRNS